MHHSIIHESGQIEFTIKRRARKTIAIQVHRDMSVEVIAPLKAGVALIVDFVKERSNWISKKISYFKTLPPKASPKTYENGEIHTFLGQSYTLKLERAIKTGVEIADQNLIVKTHYPTNKLLTKQLVEDWFLKQAHKHFHEMTDIAITRFAKPKLMLLKKTIIKPLKSKWGSMSSCGIMTLNLKLIHAPKECIDYVIIHELCHIIHHNHSKDFWALVSMIMPDWKERKKRLEATK